MNDRKAHERQIGGAAAFAVTLLLVVPAVLAFLASAAIVRGIQFPASALWFVYKISLYAGYVGVGAGAVFTIFKAARRRISAVYVSLMGIVVAIGIFSLWYASHVFRSPWYAKP